MVELYPVCFDNYMYYELLLLMGQCKGRMMAQHNNIIII